MKIYLCYHLPEDPLGDEKLVAICTSEESARKFLRQHDAYVVRETDKLFLNKRWEGIHYLDDGEFMTLE